MHLEAVSQKRERIVKNPFVQMNGDNCAKKVSNRAIVIWLLFPYTQNKCIMNEHKDIQEDDYV